MKSTGKSLHSQPTNNESHIVRAPQWLDREVERMFGWMIVHITRAHERGTADACGHVGSLWMGTKTMFLAEFLLCVSVNVRVGSHLVGSDAHMCAGHPTHALELVLVTVFSPSGGSPFRRRCFSFEKKPPVLDTLGCPNGNSVKKRRFGHPWGVHFGRFCFLWYFFLPQKCQNGPNTPKCFKTQ